ncbi:MAG TPA: dTDP-4-dehydrorhamnose 3,5-epimerase family protein [Oscillospiraceae bacterium]|nr:dTDP-4-dehydrorhamnose 3,5-epimerase family protein [Oscillospiraceae bacterium]
MQIKTSKIDGCKWVITRTLQEDKGWFSRTYAFPDWAKGGVRTPFLYDGEMVIAFKNTWRGLYRQCYPYEYSILIRCIHGKSLVVAVDMREESETYLKYVIFECNSENKLQVYLEKGFAFGFLTLEDNTELQIKTDAPFSDEYQVRYRWDDPAIDLQWPEEHDVDPSKFIISAFDSHAKLLEIPMPIVDTASELLEDN